MTYEKDEICPRGKYHDIFPIGDEVDAVVERCRLCGRKFIWRKVDSRIDNVRYLRVHIRDFCQPGGATAKVFREIYGEKQIKENRKRAAAAKGQGDAIAEGVGEAKEHLKIWKRLSSKGYTEKEIERMGSSCPTKPKD